MNSRMRDIAIFTVQILNMVILDGRHSDLALEHVSISFFTYLHSLLIRWNLTP